MEPLPTHAACSACGTSPIDHRVAYALNIIDEAYLKTIGALFGALRIPLETSFTNRILGVIFWCFNAIGIVRFSTDISKASNERSELIWREAAKRDISMEQLVLFGRHLDHYRARLHNRWIYFESLPIPFSFSQQGYAWMDDKFTLALRLEKAGVPAPKARLAASWESTLRAFNELPKPVIVKPRVGSRGRHTTTNINTTRELKVAYNLARQIARELVIEEHLFGSVCRATVINKKLVGFFKADPPRIMGDDTHSVSELIAMQNKNRPARIGAIRVTDDVREFIARKGYTTESVLSKGVTLELTAKTGRFFGGYTREMLPDVHPKLHDIFKKAAELVSVPVAGFDCIMVDPTTDPNQQRWGIIECNSLPFIDLHYFPFAGTPNNLAPHVWDLWATS
jgi:D-alanine-D-alanine ligase-like ATP-grasp enzyme